jgi:methanogenic corrinoid protein MtbC1
VALAATDAGWRPLYLGPNLPAEAIAAAVEQTGATAVAVSMGFTVNSQQLIREMRKLGQLLNERTAMVAGGRANAALRAALEDMGIRWCDTLEALHFALLDEKLVNRGQKT